MPWQKKDAKRHTKQANTEKKQRRWSEVANSILKKGGSEGSAIRQANYVTKKS